MSIDKFGRSELGQYFYNPYATSATTGDLYVRTDGNSTIVSDIDFNSHKIINLGEPTSAHDAATKNYVDTHSSGGSGGDPITSDLDLNTHKLINVVNPTNLQDAATKNYVDASTSQCVKTDGSSAISGNIDLNSHRLVNVADPTNSYDAATKTYVDSKIAYSNTFYTDINMTSHKFTNLAEATFPSDSATKNYVDTYLSGGTSSITSDLNLNTHKLINVTDPTNAQDAATKNYVDTNSQKSTYLGIDVKSSFSSLGLKSQTLPVNLSDATSIFSYSDGPEILRRLWIAVNGTSVGGKSVPGNVFLRIYVDDVICVGNYATDTQGIGYDHIPLALDLLFAPLGGPYYANALQGCNVSSTSNLGGYFTLDMPFRTSLDIRLFNNNSSAVTYWVQPFISIFTTIPPSLSSIKLHSVTFRYYNTTYGNEYILMNFQDIGNGVFLKYIRMHVIGASGNWWESRLRIYDGVNVPPGDGYVISPWTPYNGNNYTFFPGYDGTSKCIFSSSGLEDSYLSSWNGSNLTSFNNESSGLLCQSTSGIGSTTTISFYRNFGHSETMPSVSTGRRMLVTLNSGDAQVGQSGSFLAVIGQAYFYA